MSCGLARGHAAQLSIESRNETRHCIPMRRMVIGLRLWILYLSTWAVLVASFAIGMLKDIVFGLKVLGYGLSGVLVLAIAVIVCLRLEESVYRWRRLRRDRCKREKATGELGSSQEVSKEPGVFRRCSTSRNDQESP